MTRKTNQFNNNDKESVLERKQKKKQVFIAFVQKANFK